MNLFRSEEDARAWNEFDPKTEKAIRPVREWAAILTSARLFQKRLEDDFVEKSEEYGSEALGGLGQVLG